MSVTLPTGETNPGKAEWSEVYGNDKALRDAIEVLQGSKSAFTWYTPKVIATEQTRESTAYGTLTTADEIKEVVLPENGLIVVGYMARAKNSVATAGSAAIFLNENEVRQGNSTLVNVGGEANVFYQYCSGLMGIERSLGAVNSFATTGELLSATNGKGGVAYIYAAAGTYNVSVRWKATSGSITAKDRKLWVYTLGA